MLGRILLQKCHLKATTRNCRRLFTVLALESSADDTCAAVVTSDARILSNVVIKQNNVHEKWGGIYTIEAIEYHQRNLPGAIQRALKDANMAAPDLDGVAFTRGPGMRGCLSASCNAAKALAAALGKPLVGVHHMQAHALTALFSQPPEERPTFPFLTLLISGGHTLLLVARSPSEFEMLATTPDMSIGNAYDKVSRILGLEWESIGPGAALEKFCAENPPPPEPQEVFKPRLRVTVPNPGELMFSYSGLYSAVQRHCELITPEDFQARKVIIAWAFQQAAVGQLEQKLKLGLKWCERHGVDVRHVVVSGGVASNLYLRERLHVAVQEAQMPEDVKLVFPPIPLCTDNAIMIGWASMDRFLNNDTDPYDIAILPTWNIEDLSNNS